VKAGEYGVTLAFGENSQIKSIALDTPTGHCEISRVIGAPPLHFLSSSGFLKFIVSESEQKPSGASSVSGDRPDEVELDTLAFLIWHVRDAIASRPYATAPVRTKPQRTYDPITDAQ
jgi:hypothetical protein